MTVTEPAPDVLVHTSRTMRTTSTVLRHGTSAVVVDPAWHADELDHLADLLAEHDLTPTLGWSTHAHHDHVLWHPRFGNASRLTSPTAARTAAAHLTEIRAALELPPDLLALAGQVQAHDGDRLPWPGPEVQVLTHQAHAPGHSALWLPGSEVLIAGDMLSDVEIPLLETSTLAEYRAGLDLLAPLVEQAQVLIPGHGRIAHAGTADSPMARLAADRAYLDSLTAPGSDPRLRHADPWLHEAHRQNLRHAQ
ncbi:MBL fold metallo-hydrolase [Ruania alba]|uniref:Glyoxylase, beta-lactamase superfamily II n=1 Tax=Ruania alba TaxID=648782 RepID=A0A1H5KDN7_9MICO|nr:MBL fold metallo-hydrolase [Ruania alba]SEE62913.1 Glyoxylase, beta-lactamase superfamily II [Ruania alba]